MHAACHRGALAVAQWLHEQGVPLDVVDIFSRQPMHDACNGGQLDVARWLHEQGVALDVVSDDGGQPMHEACSGGELAVARWLHEQGVPLDIVSNDGGQPMHFACSKGQLDVARWLHEQGVPLDVVDIYGRHPMHDACNGVHLDVAQWLHEQGVPLDVMSNSGGQPMHDACHGGALDVARWLHEQGVPLDVVSNDGGQPMHFACSGGHLGVARWLHEQGVPLDVVDNVGGQPMHFACYGGQLDVARWLHEQGVPLDVVDNLGDTPAALARRHMHDAVVAWLENLPGSSSTLGSSQPSGAATSSGTRKAAAQPDSEAMALEQKLAHELARQSAKAAEALREDGFALHPLAKTVDSNVWNALEQLIHTKDRSQLGKGKDVTRTYGEYDELRLVSAWRIDHPSKGDLYEAAKGNVIRDMQLLARRGAHKTGAQPKGLPVATATATAGFSSSAEASEAFLLHGLGADRLLSVLNRGLNERYSGTNAGTAFGEGVYLAEDVGKTDQYAAPDAAYDHSNELHRRLYGSSNRHQGSVFYVLVCRALLGYPARTREHGQSATHIDTRRSLFPMGYRELAAVPNVVPETPYHSLIVERGYRHDRYREFVLFHGEYVLPVYLLAYQRCQEGAIVHAPGASAHGADGPAASAAPARRCVMQ